MPEFHDLFWRSLFFNIFNFSTFLSSCLKVDESRLDLKSAKFKREIYVSKKKKIVLDLLIEVSYINSNNKLFFLLEHKSRKDSDFLTQINKYRFAIQTWQIHEFGKLYPVLPILFYQGIDSWNPEESLNKFINPLNTFLPQDNPQILIFNLKIFDLNEMENSINQNLKHKNRELLAGLFILKYIKSPWKDFLYIYRKVQVILSLLEESKRIDLEERIQDYIFKSRTEDYNILEEAIMGKRVLTAYERALEEGKLEGKLEGRLEGRTEKALETARRMRDFGDSLEKISIISGLSEVELRENGIM